MVKKTFFIVLSAFFLNLISTALLTAAELTASVSSTQVELTDRFSLYLTLKDSSAKEAPDISVLKEHFLIHSHHKSTNTTIVNGKVSSNITWKLSLTPKMEGQLQIPPMSVNTTDGVLSTQPILLNVTKGADHQSNEDTLGLNMFVKTSSAAPYQNEPIIYTALLTSKLPIYNVQTQKMQVEDAIVELIDEPKLEQRVIDGVMLHTMELNYLITPLKSGSLTIPSVAVQGNILQKRKGQLRSFFTDDFDPFSAMQGFERPEPFTILAEAIPLEILPAVPSVSPWLPARDLVLEEHWKEDQTLRVGEPFSRSILIKAEGVKATQLPHLEDLQSSNSAFKSYADKPEEKENIVDGIIYSTRKEQYTLIPQQAGTCVLPEISISWWDSSKKEKRTSIIAARTLQVLPAIETATSSSQQIDIVPREMPPAEKLPPSFSPSSMLYGIIATLAFLLTGALIWGFTLQRKIASLTQASSSNPKQMPSSKVFSDRLDFVNFESEKQSKSAANHSESRGHGPSRKDEDRFIKAGASQHSENLSGCSIINEMPPSETKAPKTKKESLTDLNPT
ncbi:MAG: BatD family protein [Verrucomicrobia bacterium]|nr:BatD family protein [Verrucomicrobiota bacterium]